MSAPSATKVRGSDFSVLCRQIQNAGLLERRRASYANRIALTLAFFVTTWVAVVWIGNSWFQLIAAVVMGVAFTQVAFLGHDGGHRQVFSDRRKNDLLVLISGNLLTGLSVGWWVDKHNKHHANPNKEGHDPDIGDGVFAFTTNQVARRTGRFGKAIVRGQAWLFFPILTLEGLNLHVASFISLFTAGRRHPMRVTEFILLSAHMVAYFGGLLLVMSPVKALVFVAIHQATFGLYMGCSFAPNHKGMLSLTEDEELDFLRRQVLTSRNVRGGWFIDLLLGGLNYQVEHHLFPSMPRPSLRKAQQLVRDHCRDLHIPYAETSLMRSYIDAVRHLHSLGAPLRQARMAASSGL
jgi:fatty acid desaturase